MESNTSQRITIVAVLIALIFAISEYYNKFLPNPDSAIEVGMSVLSKVSIHLAIPLFLLYLLGLSIQMSHNSPKPRYLMILSQFFYDLAVSIILSQVLFIVAILSGGFILLFPHKPTAKIMFYIFALFLVWIGFRFISKTLTRYIEFIKHEKRWLPRNKRITISTIMVVLALIIIVIGSNQIYIEWKTNKMEKKMRSYNETCKSNGGDYASPLIDEKFVGFNCCKNINDSSINCTKNTVV